MQQYERSHYRINLENYTFSEMYEYNMMIFFISTYVYWHIPMQDFDF